MMNSGSPIRILLVDNDTLYREALLRYFSSYPGFEIYEASNGSEGLNTARQVEPDLILSEYQIPGMSGLEFCRMIRSIPQTRPAIFLFLTHSKDEKETIAAFECGADDYIQKSTAPVIITSKIASFLRIKQLQNDLLHEKKKLAEVNDVLEHNFRELTEILLKIIDVRVPGAADRARAAKEIARFISEKAGIQEAETSKILFAAQLHEIGKIGLPDTIADKSKNTMVMNDRSIYNQHPVIGSLVISTISGYKISADAIYHQYENFDGSGTPAGLIGNEIPMGARILRGIVMQNDLYRAGHSRDTMLREIRQSAMKILDPAVASSLVEYLIEKDRDFTRNKYKIPLEELEPGMIVAEDIYAASGIKLIPRDVELADHMIELLMERNTTDPIIGGVYVQSKILH